MFKSASLRLTVWYLTILMTVSIIFSLALFVTSSREVDRNLRRVPFPVYDFVQPYTSGQGFADYRDQRIKAIQGSLVIDLLIFNLVVLLTGGAVSYALARRTLQPIEDALEAQSRFTADASHELRTPLAALRSEIEVALRGKKLSEKEARELLASNLEEVQKLEALAGGLLLLAQVGDQPSTTTRAVPVEAILAEAVKRLKREASAHKIEVTITAPKDLKVRGDEASLTELMIILLDNAIKYGKSATTVQLRAKSQGGRVIIEVQDEGAGIATKDLPHIFDRFYRVDSSRSKNTASGYGLGLAIARQITDRHDGQLTVHSKLGGGTTFTVSLPQVANK
jgi:signal transduction histidine kinase